MELRLDTSHIEIARSLAGLGGLYARRGEVEQAEPVLQRACTIFDLRLGANNDETVQARNEYHALREQRNKK